jgi:PEGA domain
MKRLAKAGLALMLTLLPAAARAQYYPPVVYGYPYGGESSLRLAVTPREAMVYVDGYLAGTVDEFDGVFQRLHVIPGEHEITLYLDGYRTKRQRLYLAPLGDRKITFSMEKLAAGETPEPPPEPPSVNRMPAPLDPNQQEAPPNPQDGGRQGPSRGRQRPPRDLPPPSSAPLPPPQAPAATATGGSLVMRIQPPLANVIVDGQAQKGPSDSDERLVIQVAEGHHRIEVRKDGYTPFSTEVDVRRGDSVPINVSLAREGR